MKKAQSYKSVLVTGWVLGVLLFAFTSFTAAENGQGQPAPAASADDYMGNDSCKACHEQEYENFQGTPHAAAAHSRFETDMSRGCESCHGPAKEHVLCETKRKEAMDLGQEAVDCAPGLIGTFRGKSPKDVSDNCLSCHAGMGEEHINYRRGEHWRNDVGCTDCHDPHGMPRRPDKLGPQTFVESASRHKPDWGSEVMLRASEPQLCFQCHNEIRAQFTMPFRHRVLEGALSCSDCHNPHGGFESRQTRLAVGADAACVKCHTDKQGPFAFEHAPLKLEGCAACHTPHGSANPRMLRRADVFQLCIECHTDVGNIGVGQPGTPSFHNLAQEKWRNCTTCHVQIHGSQSHPLYFR
jgi:predicted CXXCH cytochrome family protein